MSNLAKLRANALGHLTSRKFRYPVCLEPEKRTELRRLADLIRTTADAAAARAAELVARPDAEDAPTRRSIGDRTPTVQALAEAAERAIEPLNERTRAILAEAAAADQLVVVVFGMPAGAQNDPAAWYASVKDGFEQPSVQADAVMRRLVELSYERTETPSEPAEDLEFDWDTVRTKVLNHADLEIIDQQVLELYREPSSIPFDPANCGERPPS